MKNKIIKRCRFIIQITASPKKRKRVGGFAGDGDA